MKFRIGEALIEIQRLTKLPLIRLFLRTTTQNLFKFTDGIAVIYWISWEIFCSKTSRPEFILLNY